MTVGGKLAIVLTDYNSCNGSILPPVGYPFHLHIKALWRSAKVRGLAARPSGPPVNFQAFCRTYGPFET